MSDEDFDFEEYDEANASTAADRLQAILDESEIEEAYHELRDEVVRRTKYQGVWSHNTVTNGLIPPRALWDDALAEIVAWADIRWGRPIIAILGSSYYKKVSPTFYRKGAWAVVGRSVLFRTKRQAMEFKLRWNLTELKRNQIDS